jgi:hypothetical protein
MCCFHGSFCYQPTTNTNATTTTGTTTAGTGTGTSFWSRQHQFARLQHPLQRWWLLLLLLLLLLPLFRSFLVFFGFGCCYLLVPPLAFRPLAT